MDTRDTHACIYIITRGKDWRVSHSEGILESLITGTITGEAITGSQSIGWSYRPPACLNTVSVWQAGLG